MCYNGPGMLATTLVTSPISKLRTFCFDDASWMPDCVLRLTDLPLTSALVTEKRLQRVGHAPIRDASDDSHNNVVTQLAKFQELKNRKPLWISYYWITENNLYTSVNICFRSNRSKQCPKHDNHMIKFSSAMTAKLLTMWSILGVCDVPPSGAYSVLTMFDSCEVQLSLY